MSPPFEVVEVTLRSWDHHMDSCTECLAEGQHLCYEGEYLTEKVVTAREAGRLASSRPHRLVLPSPLRRPTLPGVPA